MPWRTSASETRFVTIVGMVLFVLFLFQGSGLSQDNSADIALESEPRMMALNPVTNRAVVTHGRTGSISIVDLNTARVIRALSIGRLPKGVAIDTELNLAVITKQGERSVTLVDLNKNSVVADIHIGNFTGSIAVNSRTHIAAVTSRIDFHVYFVDLIKKKVVGKTRVGLNAIDIAIDPIRNTALVLSPIMKTLRIIDMNSYRIIDTIYLEKRPQAIDVNPLKQKAIIASYREHSITELDLLTRRATVIPVHRYPLDVAVNTIDNRAVILCERDQLLLVMDLDTYSIIKSYQLPRHPRSVALNSLKNFAVVADDELDALTIIPLPRSTTLPKIKITSPADNAEVPSGSVTVAGTVENSADVLVNGQAASVTGNTFSVSLTMKTGQNTIAAVATDPHGRTACDTVTVTVADADKATINGTVISSITGRLIPLAMVTIKDSEGETRTVTTIFSGTFTAEIAAGAYTGSVIKLWYLPYSFSGTAIAGETHAITIPLTPGEPVIEGLIVKEVTESTAQISWKTDQPTQCRVEYGTTTAYGSIVSASVTETKHSVVLTGLSASTTYHFRVIAESESGTRAYSVDKAFMTRGQINSIVISSPADGANISGNRVFVRGSISNPAGVETGVTVNGLPASLSNNQFAVNDVPLNTGQNTITVVATDINGTKATKSITVHANIPENFIELSAYPESGVAPLEVALRINGTFSITDPVITATGPGTVEQIPSDNPDEYRYRLNSEGIYSFTLQAIGPGGNAYTDTRSITVLPLQKMDTLLKRKWSELKTALNSSDIDAASLSFVSESRNIYKNLYNDLRPILQDVVNELNMAPIHMIAIGGAKATYEIIVTRDGIAYSFQLEFLKDTDGIWRIYKF